ncbi:MAG: ABC transporter permease [Deltaproteobacteria bacterium]|nr:ABC transporter permease [Deltaproteobacteria bacterium]
MANWTNLHKLAASVSKEARQITRDREALLLLFAMPLLFVLIMSLAMRDAFREKGGVVLPIIVVDNDRSTVGSSIVDAFSALPAFKVDTAIEGGATDERSVRADVASGKHKFAVIIPEGTDKNARRRIQRQLRFVKGGTDGAPEIRLLADPAMRFDYRNLASTNLNRALQAIENRLLWEEFAALAGMKMTPERRQAAKEILTGNRPFAEVSAEDAAALGRKEAMPTAVQQSVPSWSLFGVFFLVIPLSVAFTKERQAGCLQRLRSMPTPLWVVMAGKAVSYFIINQIQFALMILMGIYAVPLLGGDRFAFGHAPLAVAMMSVAVSLAAVNYGLAAAAYCKTAEQATTFGGASVLIFGALGGIMVPKFLMPPVMQRLSAVSPMSWGLDGYLNIFVRNGTVRDILPQFAGLVCFAVISAAIAALKLRNIQK